MSRRATAARSRVGAAVVAWALLVAALSVGGTAPAAAQDTVAFTITNHRITSSSGLAADPDADFYWTANHSGESSGGSQIGRAYALDSSGTVQGTVNFRAAIVDVEAVAYAANTLYVADIGDPQRSRDHVTVYLLSSPRPAAGTVYYHAYDFAYPDGPHDAGTLLVSPSGRLYLVTKDKTGGIYEAPAQPSRSSVNTLTRIADAPPYVTDGVFLPGGRIALRSYVDVSILDPAKNYKVVARAATPYQQQGESVAVSLDGNNLLVGSEGAKSAVYSMPIPSGMKPAPTPAASPPQSPAPASPSASPSSDSTQAEQDTNVNGNSGPGRGGTLVALILAAAVAVLAGGIAFSRGRSSW
ncbi:MAG: hypothetical protein J2P23_05440 [Microlunatus sp.]|nr:hypothetical protein [Microlunatus sp.]